MGSSNHEALPAEMGDQSNPSNLQDFARGLVQRYFFFFFQKMQNLFWNTIIVIQQCSSIL